MRKHRIDWMHLQTGKYVTVGYLMRVYNLFGWCSDKVQTELERLMYCYPIMTHENGMCKELELHSYLNSKDFTLEECILFLDNQPDYFEWMEEYRKMWGLD